MELRPGALLGPYRLVQHLSNEGPAEVWRAYQPSLERFVAVKVLSPEAAARPELLARFRQEARSSSRQSRAGSRPIYDFGEQDGFVYLVTSEEIDEPAWSQPEPPRDRPALAGPRPTPSAPLIVPVEWPVQTPSARPGGGGRAGLALLAMVAGALLLVGGLIWLGRGWQETGVPNASPATALPAAAPPTPAPVSVPPSPAAVVAAVPTLAPSMPPAPTASPLPRPTAPPPLQTARWGQSATLLLDGRLLVVGGRGATELATAELFDPRAGRWQAAGALGTARQGHAAALLPNGQVLVSGGVTDTRVPLASAELFDPGRAPAEAWLAARPMSSPRLLHTATSLSDGRVLVAGGFASDGVRASAERFDPTSGDWLAVSPLAAARWAHTATLLADGQVLVVGGRGSLRGDEVAQAERYDPATNRWSPAGRLATARADQASLRLPDGQVLVVGGTTGVSTALASVERYDPASNSWQTLAPLSGPRAGHSLTLLPDGQVLVVGGRGSSASEVLASAERYDPAGSAVAAWRPAGQMSLPHANHTATLLADGQLLIVGGVTSGNSPVAAVERYDPVANTWASPAR